MLSTELLRERHMSLTEYEHFSLEWTRECARLNPTEANVLRLEIAEKRARLMKLETR